jgi:hypothetical protein
VSEEEAFGGKRAWKLRGKLLTWERPLRNSDLTALGANAPSGPILGVRTADLEMKDVLLQVDSGVFFTTPHFDGYPAILIRLDQIASKQLKEVMVEAWLAQAPRRAVEAYLLQGGGLRRSR